MKTGRALPDVLTELKRQQDAKRDYISPASSLVLQEDGRALRMGENTFGTTELFHRQVASALNIPGRNPASKRNIATGKLGNAAGRK